MEHGTRYYRTRQHVVPNRVPSESRVVEHGWGLVCLNFRTMRSGSAEKHFDNGGFGGMFREDTGLVRVELLRFQMALGVAGQEEEETSRFHDLAAMGTVKFEERESVLREWCDSGVIPGHFRLVGTPNAQAC